MEAKDEGLQSVRAPKPPPLKRTFTDTLHVSLQDKLIDTLAQPFLMGPPGEPVLSPLAAHSVSAAGFPSALGSIVHGHSSRWVPATQAIFTTESQPPWTILAANDLACLVFGVTKAEVRKMGILEVVQEERRAWLEKKLLAGGADDSEDGPRDQPAPTPAASAATALLGGRTGITAQLLSKPNSRSQPKKRLGRRSQTVNSSARVPDGPRHRNSQSRGVLICGDVIPIQKRNGTTGSASLWVKEKRVGLIWVLEEIHEDVALLTLGEEGVVQEVSGALESIWGADGASAGADIGTLIPRIPRQGIDPRTGEIDFAQASKRRYFTCPHYQTINIPCTVEQVRGRRELRVSSFPHIAGIIVVSPGDLTIKSSNSAFCGALFGYEKADGKSINTLIPDFDKTLKMLTDEDGVMLEDGIVVPEHSFRKASVYVAIREGRTDAAAAFLRPEGVPARHRDGSELKIDVQMRVVQSERQPSMDHETTIPEYSRRHGGSGRRPYRERVRVRPLGNVFPLLAFQQGTHHIRDVKPAAPADPRTGRPATRRRPHAARLQKDERSPPLRCLEPNQAPQGSRLDRRRQANRQPPARAAQDGQDGGHGGVAGRRAGA